MAVAAARRIQVADYRALTVDLRADAAPFVAVAAGGVSASITAASAARRFTASMPLRHDSLDS